MSDQNVIARLSAEVNLGNGIESIQMSFGINSIPTATLMLGQNKSDVILRPITSEVLAEIQKHQKARLSGVANPDITIAVDDGVYGNMEMNGFLAAPMLEISGANIGYQMSVIEQVAQLDILDLSIYCKGVGGPREAETPQELPMSKDGNVTKLLADITDYLVGSYQLAYAKEEDPVKKQIIALRHQMNLAGPLDVWKGILANSTVIHESWAAAIESNSNNGYAVSRKTLDMLMMRSSGFWNVVNMLCSGYQMFYRPEPGAGENYGRFVNNKDKIDNVQGEMELDIINLNVRDGSSTILQVGGVLMELQGANGMRAGETPGASSPFTAAMYPDPIKPGYIHHDIPPIWLIESVGVPVRGSKIDEKKNEVPGDSPPNYSQPEYKERREKAVEHLTEMEKTRSAVMDSMCEATFKQLQLADSVMSVTVPLNMTIEVGVRKTIKLGDAGSVKGFIAGVNHRIALSGGKDLDSFSQVTITHVEY